MPLTTQSQITFAPYGVNDDGTAFGPLPTQVKIREWVQARCLEPTAERKDIPVLYVEHGVNAGGTRGILGPAMELILQLPGMRVLCGRKDFNDLRLSAMMTFLEGDGDKEPPICPPELVAGKDTQEHRFDIQGERGVASVFFRNLTDIKGLGSQQFGLILVHEAHEITLPMYRTLKHRCRQRGYPCIILMEGNPPPTGHWLSNLRDPGHPDFDAALTVLTLASTENWDNMDPGYRASLSAMPASWRRRYLLGLVGSLPEGAPVYPAFVAAIHSRTTSIIPDRPIIRSWDFGWRRAACLWGQRTDWGQLLVHREWMALETPETEFIEGVKMRTNDWFGDRTVVDYGDPAARNRDPHGISTLARMDQAGIQMMYRQSTYAQRIPLINQRLSLLLAGHPAIIVNPLCTVLTEGLEGGYHYPSINIERKFTEGHEVPFHDQWYSHLANAFEYLMVNLFLGATSSKREERREKKRRKRLLRGERPRTVVGF